MSLNSEYPKKYNLYDLGTPNFKKDTQMWMGSRGFLPLDPLSYTDDFDTHFLVIPLYKDRRLVSYQLRDMNDEETETKYKFSKPVYESFLTTDTRDIPGRIVICEGSIDCMLLREHGVNAHTCLGLKKFKIIRLIEELEHEKFIYIVDNDSYGRYFDKAFFSKHGIGFPVPAGAKDVNELFLSDKPLFLKYLTNLKRLLTI